MKRKLIVAHRGDSHGFRENTVAAVESAIQMGADAVEVDIQQTLDGQLICYHDEILPNTSLKPIAACTYKEAQEVFLDYQLKVPLLEEMLEICQGKILCDVEVKGSTDPLRTAEVCLAGNDNFQIKSFSPEAILKVKNLFPAVVTGLVVGLPRPQKYVRTRIRELFPMKAMEQCKADQIHPHWKLLRLGFLGRMFKAKKPVWVWCVDEAPWLIKWLQDVRITALITNEPNRAIKIQDELLIRHSKLNLPLPLLPDVQKNLVSS